MLNTKLRTTVKIELQKYLFKFMNNSVSGKTMENIRNRKDMKLVTSGEEYVKYVMQLNFKVGNLFKKNYFLEMGKSRDQDERATITWKNNIKHNQDINV